MPKIRSPLSKAYGGIFASGGTKLLATKGVEIEREQPSIFDEQFPSPKPMLSPPKPRRKLNSGMRSISSSRPMYAVLVLGEAQTMSGERASRSSLVLPGKQQQLLEAAVATGKPVVLVLINGRPAQHHVGL